jgi:hypothetical protein
MGSSRPWNATVQRLIENSRSADQPVWLDQAVKDILREHPDCELSPRQLGENIRKAVIERQWSFTD